MTLFSLKTKSLTDPPNRKPAWVTFFGIFIYPEFGLGVFHQRLIPHSDAMNTLFLDIHVQAVPEPNIPFQSGNPDTVSAFWSGLAK